MTDYLHSTLSFDDERVVDAYDELPLWSASFGLLLLDRVPMRAGMKVLDVGCGMGFPLLELAGRLGPAADLYGIDPWHGGVQRARLKAEAYGLKNVHIIEGDAANTKFDDGSFDLITSNLGINNFTDPDAVLRECHRLLRRRGTLAITSNYSGHMKELYAKLAKHVPRELLREHVNHRSTPKKIKARLENAGFTVRDSVTRSFRMRYANGAALFNNYFIRLGFFPSWRDMVPEPERVRVFQALERAMPREIALTIPMVYVEATR